MSLTKEVLGIHVPLRSSELYFMLHRKLGKGTIEDEQLTLLLKDSLWHLECRSDWSLVDCGVCMEWDPND